MGQIMTKVWTRISVAGTHYWPEAPRSYLSSPHRHLFVINVSCQVPRTFTNINDRSVEFFELQDRVRGILRRLYGDVGHSTPAMAEYDFETRSCERIALEIATLLSSFPPMSPPGATEVEVDVSEDGESGGAVAATQHDAGLAVFVCGKAYSGKSTIAEHISKALFNCDVVEVSDIVRKFVAENVGVVRKRPDGSDEVVPGSVPIARSDLQASTQLALARGRGVGWLVVPVLEASIRGIERTGAVVVSGVREHAVVTGTWDPLQFRNTRVVYLKVEAPDDVRQYRLQQDLLLQTPPSSSMQGPSLGDLGQQAKEELPKIDEGDWKLGLDEVLAKCPFTVHTSEQGSPVAVARLATRYILHQYVDQCVARRSE